MIKGKAEVVAYLLVCVDLEDWHGVSDAANDIRCMEAKEDGQRVIRGRMSSNMDNDGESPL